MNRTGEWSIQQLARITGTTSRTLRHYGSLGLLEPSRIGANGYRYYGQPALVRLQRILLLRELGLGLAAIADVLAGETDAATALGTHLGLLEQEQARLGRQIASVRTTLDKTRRGEPLMAEEMFDGFDHTRYKDEVIERWGAQAYESSDAWWRSLSDDDKSGFRQRQLDIAADYGRAHGAGLAPDSPEVQEITGRHYEWVAAGWQGRRPGADAFAGLGEMYVADPRFAENYDRHGAGTAAFVRDAMLAYAADRL
ncbi:MerR family transcriptional regulator [Prescottella agglutinans]|uniref:DNA-binding transcriptional MerR regulator n=1 Tax=Prescottella agglutinans TaxID=1644129 RepID=A0ABT6MD86_9NOCA|nr:MerR family transcriptional regulator [Prescottella agglutinans]MDH6282205.1 DNA-binding transcriptional MerR regulator [Prescottella agglutinans]